MTITGAEPIFLDTNILVYASLDASPWYTQTRTLIAELEARSIPLWISRQVLREYLATLIRPRLGIPITLLTATIR